VYGHLAELLVAASPVPLAGRCCCDIGSGTGAASAALRQAGARVVATDFAFGMLALDRSSRPPSAVADAAALPFADASLDGVVAAYCYNHLTEPVRGLAEARRVCAPGSPVLASSYALDDSHPVKDAVERAMIERGWEVPAAYIDLKNNAVPKLATVERCEKVAADAGLRDVKVSALRVPFPDLGIDDLIEWRLGMAQIAWFAERLTPPQRKAAVDRARELLGDDVAPLQRSVIHIVGVV
jgi:SAM-dependent methyltransferase